MHNIREVGRSVVLLIPAALLVLSCGRSGQPETSSLPPEWMTRLEERRASYLDLIPGVQDEAGFVDTDQCDSLLHTALLGAGEVPVDLAAAREDSGRWLRRPISLPECLSEGRSKSTISRDMLLGVIWYGWASRDRDLLERLWSYGEVRWWRMGDSDGSLDGMSRIYLTPNMQALLAEAIHQLGGADHTIRHWPARMTGGLTGFQKHLELLGIILWQEMRSGLTPAEGTILAQYLARYPGDALVRYATGDLEETARLLLQDHPEGRLPTSDDMCSPMAYERDSLDPCPGEGRAHAPIHFIFISKLLQLRAGN